MRNALFLAYPQYADFEIAHALFLLKKIGNFTITTVTIDGKVVESIGGIQTQSTSIKDINVAEFEVILIAGGDGVQEILYNESVKNLLENAFQLNIPIASICASALLLAKAGILIDKKITCLLHTYENNQNLFRHSRYTGNDIEIAGSIITAKGTAFAKFAVSVCRQVGLLQDQKEYNRFFNFCRGISS
ncbi:MAG: DJ-1/PfpI family protein [Bacillus sp. (in: firmicutes)]